MTTAWELAVTCPMMPSSGHVLNCSCWRPGWGLLGVSAVRIRTCIQFRLYNSVKMASIKEKAAALNLAEKLCVRPQGEPLVAPDRSVFVCVAGSIKSSPSKKNGSSYIPTILLDLFPLTKLTFTVLYCLLMLLFTCAVFNLWLPVCVPAHGVSMKSVRSSCFWNALILHLKSSVAVKPRRLFFKSYSDCFLGSEAVDVLEEYLKGLKGLEGTFDEGDHLYSNIW